MGPPFPRLRRQFYYGGATVQVVESVPGQFIAVVHYLTKPDEVLMNPVRGDHFRHLESACKYAKRVIRGKPYRAPKPK